MKYLRILLLILVVSFSSCKKETKIYPYVPTPIEYEEVLIFDENFQDQGEWIMDTIRQSFGYPYENSFTDLIWDFSNGTMKLGSRIIDNTPNIQDTYYFIVTAKHLLPDTGNFHGYRFEIGAIDLSYWSKNEPKTIHSPHFSSSIGETKISITLGGIDYQLHGATRAPIEHEREYCKERFQNDTLEYTVFNGEKEIVWYDGSNKIINEVYLWHFIRNGEPGNGCISFANTNIPNQINISVEILRDKVEFSPTKGYSSRVELDFIRIYALKLKE